MKFRFQGQVLQKYSHIIFNEYPPSSGRFVPYGLTDGRTDGGMDRGMDRDTTKLIVAFRNFANVPTKPTTILTSKIPSVKRLLSAELHNVSKFGCYR